MIVMIRGKLLGEREGCAADVHGLETGVKRAAASIGIGSSRVRTRIGAY